MKKKSYIWENTYECDEKYRYETALYLLSMFPHAYSIVIVSGFKAPGHGKYVVDGLNTEGKRFLKMLMTTMQLPFADTNDSQMVMNNAMSDTYISIARVFKNILQNQHVHMD